MRPCVWLVVFLAGCGLGPPLVVPTGAGNGNGLGGNGSGNGDLDGRDPGGVGGGGGGGLAPGASGGSAGGQLVPGGGSAGAGSASPPSPTPPTPPTPTPPSPTPPSGGAGSGGAGAGGGGAGGAGAGGPYEAEHVFCIEETNRYRQMVGVPPIARSAELEAFANEGARQDAASRSPHGHFSSENGGGIAWAENEIPWWDGGPGDVRRVVREGLEAMWSEGPGGGHYENMKGDYGLLGCGIYAGNGEITVVQDFGDRR